MRTPSETAAALRRIASRIDSVPRPSASGAVAGLRHLLAITDDQRKQLEGGDDLQDFLTDPSDPLAGTDVFLTNYGGLGTQFPWSGKTGDLVPGHFDDSTDGVKAHLTASPDNAVAIAYFDPAGAHDQVAIWQDPGGGGFFIQGYPLEDPNDAEGPMGLDEAIAMVDEYHSGP